MIKRITSWGLNANVVGSNPHTAGQPSPPGSPLLATAHFLRMMHTTVLSIEGVENEKRFPVTWLVTVLYILRFFVTPWQTDGCIFDHSWKSWLLILLTRTLILVIKRIGHLPPKLIRWSNPSSNGQFGDEKLFCVTEIVIRPNLLKSYLVLCHSKFQDLGFESPV